MCGIYGVTNFSTPGGPFGSLLDRMGRVIEHRGPDDKGHFVGSCVGLGMRRLSIIDVAGGHQPIANEDETIWLVLNGEIYNFQGLRDELDAKATVFVREATPKSSSIFMKRKAQLSSNACAECLASHSGMQNASA